MYAVKYAVIVGIQTGQTLHQLPADVFVRENTCGAIL